VPSVAARFGGFFTLGASFAALGPGAFIYLGKPWAPLELGGLDGSRMFLVALGLGGLSTLGFPSPLLESFAEASDSISCSALHEEQVSLIQSYVEV
jgi:hypothetical protein